MNKVAIHDSICAKLNDLYARKNHDYGDSFGKSYDEYGMVMACIRLEDKLNRIKALIKNDQQVHDESIEDTLMDLANYSIMTLVERHKDEPKQAPPMECGELPVENPPVKGDHACNPAKHNCVCLTCKKDDLDCCLRHNLSCDSTYCRDYDPEEGTPLA